MVSWCTPKDGWFRDNGKALESAGAILTPGNVAHAESEVSVDDIDCRRRSAHPMFSNERVAMVRALYGTSPRSIQPEPDANSRLPCRLNCSGRIVLD